MGGKSKQAQRTKNNVRPSSSGRSAELLSGGGGAGQALFPTLLAAAPDAALNPDIALCIKKLNKKDPITKTKALQELNELIQNHKVEDLEAMLPNWTHFYRLLSLDPDRKVRELTQVCHGALAAACGRRLAPRLKALLPAWLQAQHDEHAPAQARAQASLNSTFPGNKLPEAVSFCKEEILTYLLDNLLNAEAAISKKLEGAEERAAAGERVWCGALRGLQWLAAGLPRAHDAWLAARLAPALRAAAFWSLAAHPAPHVRAAWCGCAGALAARLGAAWSGPHGARALRLLLAAPPAPHWPAALQLMRADPEWYSRLERKELVTARLLELLRSGGAGDARSAADTLLELLALLPAHVLTHHFYEEFFDAAFAGLEKKSVASSKIERQAWMNTVAECVRFVSEEGGEAGEGAAVGAHRAWLRAVLPAPAAAPPPLDDCSAPPAPAAPPLALLRPAAELMAALLKRWLQQSASSSPLAPRMERLARAFWHNVNSTLLAQVDACAAHGVGPLLDAHVQLLHTLHAALEQEPKRRQNIKFADDASPAVEQGAPPSPACEAGGAARYSRDMQDSVHRVCAHYVQYARQHGAVQPVLSGLLPLLVEFDSRELFASMARGLGGTEPYELSARALRPWLRDPLIRCEPAVDVTFLLLPHLSESEQDAVFDSFGELGPGAQRAAARAASHPHCGLAAARRWLGAAPPSAAHEALLAAARLAASGDARARSLLLATVAHDAALLSPLTVTAVLAELTAALGAGPAVPVAVMLATALAAAAPPAGYDRLLEALFALTLRTREGGELEGDTWREARAAWQDGLLALEPAARDSLSARLVAAAHDHMDGAGDRVDVPRVEHAAALLPYLLSARAAPAAVAALAARALPPPQPTRALVLPHALRHECVVGRLHCPLLEDDAELARGVLSAEDISLPELTRYLRGAVARAVFLRTALRLVDEGDEPPALAHPDVLRFFAEVLYDDALIRSLLEGYAFWIHYDVIEESSRKVTAIVEDVLAEAAPATRRALLGELSAAAARRGGHWPRARARLRPAHEVHDAQAEHLLAGLDDALTGDGFFHTLQAETSASDTDTQIRALQVLCARALLCAGACGAGGGAGGGAALQAALRPENYDPLRAADAAVDAHYRHKYHMLFDTDVSTATWRDAVCVASVAELLRAVLLARGWDAPAHVWDFATVALASLLTSLDKAKEHWADTKVALVSRAVLRLFVCVEQFVRDVRGECERRQPAPHVAALPAEWTDVFAPHVTTALFSLTLHVLDNAEAPLSMGGARVLSELCVAVRRLRWAEQGAAGQGAAGQGAAGQGAAGQGAARAPLQRVARAAAGVLAAPRHRGYKYLAYHTLRALEEPLVLEDAEKLRAWSAQGAESGDGGEEVPRPEFALTYFHHELLHLQDVMDAALAHIKVGEESCEMRVHSDSHSLALGWLLLHDALACAGALQRPELQLHYAEAHRAHGYAARLLPAALRLLPPPVLRHAADPAGSLPAPPHYADAFLAAPPLTVDEAARAEDVALLACRGVFVCVAGAGSACARGWRGAADGRAARALARLVRAYVAPVLVRAQLRLVSDHAHELPDTDVTVLWSAREVQVSTHLEERRVELSVSLAPDHPLSLPRVTAPRAHPLSPAPTTHWLALYLAYQNGSLLSALRMWVSAVSARVEAAPQCYICYCRLHPASGRLPAVPCHQCNNKFHTACLRKWFQSSNKSACPLCRSTF